MTPDQRQDAERLRAYVEREGLSSVMNATKWREVRMIVMTTLGPNAWFRAKDVRGEEPPTPSSWWSKDFAHHMPSYQAIEWLEIDPVISAHRGEEGPNFPGTFTSLLRSKSIPFSLEGRIIRITGYLRTSAILRFD